MAVVISASRVRASFLPVVVAGIPTLAAAHGVVRGYHVWVLLIGVVALGVGVKAGVVSTRITRAYLVLGASWMIWGLALLIFIAPLGGTLFAAQPRAGLGWLGDVGVGFVLGFSLIMLGVATWGLEWLRRGWVVAYVATGCVGVWEVATGHHLNTDFLQVHGLTKATEATVVSTFYNPNDYAAFAALVFPFLVWSARRARGAVRVIYMVLCLSTALIALFEGSTLSLLAIGLEVTVLGISALRRRPGRAFGVAAVILLALLAGNYVGARDNATTAITGDVTQLSTQQFGSTTSAIVRWHLLLNGLFFTWQGQGIGYGPGQFENLMVLEDRPYATTYAGTSIINAHSVFVEVLVDLGILGFAALVVFLWRVWRASDGRDAPALAARMGLAGFILAQAVSSSLVRSQVFGVFLASLLVLGTSNELRTDKH